MWMSFCDRLVVRIACAGSLCFAPLPALAAEAPGVSAKNPDDHSKKEEASAEKVWSFKLKSVKEDPNDAARIAREVVSTFMSDADFKAKAAEIRKKYERWREENREDMDRYLNDRIIPIALAATSGKTDKLKDGAVFLACYHEYGQPVPSYVSDFAKDNFESLNRILGAFTWERATAYVKAKQWRKDLDEKRKREEEGRNRKESVPTSETEAKTSSSTKP